MVNLSETRQILVTHQLNSMARPQAPLPEANPKTSEILNQIIVTGVFRVLGELVTLQWDTMIPKDAKPRCLQFQG